MCSASNQAAGALRPGHGKQWRRRLRALLLSLTVIFTFNVHAQSDSSFILTREEFLSVVRAYHPVAKTAVLQVDRAKAGVLQARGAFDPALNVGFGNKTLDGKNYYRYFNPELTIPTWYGVELLGGMEDVRGERVSPESTVGQLSYIGLKVNISGIWFDNRRAALRQAQSMLQQSEAERRLTLNNLLYEALSAYFNWQKEWQTLGIINEALTNARERYRFVRIEYEGGARPAIDTTEALTQLQSMELQQADAALAYMNATLELMNYLWLENGMPLSPTMKLYPAASAAPGQLPPLTEMLSEVPGHPKMQVLESKLDQLEIDRSLKRMYLLPKMSLKATTLGKDGNFLPGETSTPLYDNNKVAAEFRLPVFQREARGAYKAAGLKIRETGLEIDATTLSIENKIRATYNEAMVLNTQLSVAQAALKSYQLLYSGERVKFEAGESTLFLLNSRQNKLIESAQKVVEFAAKLQKAEAGLYFAAGRLE